MRHIIDTKEFRGITFNGALRHKATVSTLAILMALAATQPGWAEIVNEVTASGTAPGGVAGAVEDTAIEEVDVENADPQVVVTKTALDSGGNTPSDEGVNETITYTYTFLNDGNVTITNISLTDLHEGEGATFTLNNDEVVSGGGASTDSSTDPTPSAQDGVWDSLAPGDTVTWTATYTIDQLDITNNGGGDNNIENTVTFAATPAAGTIDPADLTATESVDLEAPDPSLDVAKLATLLDGAALADPDNANAEVGQEITYTYTVTNDGNVPITSVSLTDDVTAGSGSDPTPIVGTLTNTSGNSTDDPLTTTVVEELAPGDSVTFTGTLHCDPVRCGYASISITSPEQFKPRFGKPNCGFSISNQFLNSSFKIF